MGYNYITYTQPSVDALSPQPCRGLAAQELQTFTAGGLPDTLTKECHCPRLMITLRGSRETG